MVTALIEHTKRTYQRRVEKEPCQLLLSFIKPYVKVSSLTGIYIFIFKDHLTRAVLFSHASVADLSLDDILARGYWSNSYKWQRFDKKKIMY